MSSDRLDLLILETFKDAAKDHLPGFLGDALETAAGKVEDPFAKLAVGLLARYARTNTADNVELLADELADYIQGRSKNPSEVFALGLTAADLSDLTDQLQTAEAAHVKRVAQALRKLGTQLGTVIKILGVAAFRAATS